MAGTIQTLSSVECQTLLFYLLLTCALSFLLFLFSFCFWVVFMLSLKLCRGSSDLFLSSRPRIGLAITYCILLGIAEARSVNMKNITTTGDAQKVRSDFSLNKALFIGEYREEMGRSLLTTGRVGTLQ